MVTYVTRTSLSSSYGRRMAVAAVLDFVLIALLLGAAGDLVAVLLGWTMLGSVLGLFAGMAAERRARRRLPLSPWSVEEPDYVERFTRVGTALGAIFALSLAVLDALGRG
jgi:hypothetical protein